MADIGWNGRSRICWSVYETYKGVKGISRRESKRAMTNMQTDSFDSLNELFYNKKTQLFWKRVKQCNSKRSNGFLISIDAEIHITGKTWKIDGFNEAQILTINMVNQVDESQSQCEYKHTGNTGKPSIRTASCNN